MTPIRLCDDDPRKQGMRLHGVKVDGTTHDLTEKEAMILKVLAEKPGEVVTRDDLLDHVRTLAAWEVGLEPDSLRESATPRREAAFIAPATDIALRQLIARYCDAVVRRDTAAFEALWSHDATWLVGKAPIARADIGTTFDKAMKGYKWLVQTAPNAVFEVDEAAGVATGRVTITEQFAKRTGEGSLIGVYHDRYVRKHGSWLFAERRLEVITQTA